MWCIQLTQVPPLRIRNVCSVSACASHTLLILFLKELVMHHLVHEARRMRMRRMQLCFRCRRGGYYAIPVPAETLAQLRASCVRQNVWPNLYGGSDHVILIGHARAAMGYRNEFQTENYGPLTNKSPFPYNHPMGVLFLTYESLNF